MIHYNSYQICALFISWWKTWKNFICIQLFFFPISSFFSSFLFWFRSFYFCLHKWIEIMSVESDAQSALATCLLLIWFLLFRCSSLYKSDVRSHLLFNVPTSPYPHNHFNIGFTVNLTSFFRASDKSPLSQMERWVKYGLKYVR